jgi:hypothetical protein
VPVTLTLRSVVDGAGGDYPASTDQSGYFTVTTSLAFGDYNWRVKNSHTLANTGVLTLGGGTQNIEMGTLKEGDASNDNCVRAVDFTILKNTFAKSLGDPGYDTRADFNTDNQVGISDFNLLKSNFGLCGQ